MRHLHTQLAYSDEAIERLAAHDARVQRLRTLPSAGPVTAEAFVATIDNAQRFHHDHMRWRLIQVAVSILRRRPPQAESLHAWDFPIGARRGKHTAVVALARRRQRWCSPPSPATM